MEQKPAVYHPTFTGGGSFAEWELFFIAPESNISLADFNPIILLGGTIVWVEEGYKRDNEAVRREREVFHALEKGSVVCVTYMFDEINHRILERIGIGISGFNKTRVDIVTKRSEFSTFMKRYGAADTRFRGDFDDIICETENRDKVGFAKKVKKGVLIFLPCKVMLKQYDEPDFLRGFLPALLEALKAYGPRIQYKPPNFIDSYRFPKEASIISEIEELQKELSKRTESLNRYLKLKEILWFRDTELVNAVMNFLADMGIKTKRDEVYEEDFWILHHEKEAVMVEIKGLDKNLARLHISQLDEHRAAREKPDDFPALLVVNSFNQATSLKEKDQPISPNEIRKAVQINVLILRTLDLCNVYSLIESKRLEIGTLLKIIREESGWLRITPSGLDIIKE